MSSSELNEKISKLYAELNMLNAIAESLQRHHDALSKMILDVQFALNTLKEIREIDKGHKALIPLGSLVMINVSIEDNQHALLNVGSGIIVKKPIADIEEYLEDYLSKLQREQLNTQKRLESVMGSISNLQVELNKLLQRARQ
ncbi:MAG: prefoldin subunit alpha [Candidatus Methanomethylicota archaeon]|uniref:Prefoldin subunit alpha n=1 Tax=Thermoproteota archaeon TaxID=2056631 RepID=A0A497EY31_9CREN|nr:MAG: prefoldin subunit alpha [Candidatus Verstraetearchaeota archaeon]RLE55909.1 MAG: prefoldin subunit alpha [Candidatus Verstraetearchaeota archaeon]